ncbi:methyltransferase TRM13-domain-containing protein [Endogone sp. FLAS-F59071]|nr:methyltransferase TRM13-domain-containing protein [Endogone sp. FLAS-F59071]|eukprot:RUS18711.1 methyltransferase TRM13-domain-containing protein [Endogone sp. FLAS-F59071]
MPKEKRQKPSEAAKFDELIPPPPDKPLQCHYWVKRKRRYCHLITKAQNRYCGEHLIAEQQERETGVAKSDELEKKRPNKTRVPCPYDPSHTVYEDLLADHLANRCNSRPRPPDPWVSLNCNVTLPLTQEELDFQSGERSHKLHHVQPWLARVRLAELPREELKELMAKVRKVYEKEVKEIRTEVLDHEAMKERKYVCRGLLVQFTKHADQQASLLGHMQRLGMLDDKSSYFIEFGAGRGELSNYLKAAVNDTQGEATYMLVDRKNVRGKVRYSMGKKRTSHFPLHRLAILIHNFIISPTQFDKALLGAHPARKSTVKRICCDIKDLDLSRVDALQGGGKKIVALSKHLCGSATDITLKCLIDTPLTKIQPKNYTALSSTIAGIVIALCCHQLCRWPMYPNPNFLAGVGFTQADFERACKMTSWAICGQRSKVIEGEGKGEDENENENDEESEEREHAEVWEEEDDADETDEHYSGLTHVEREVLGYQCKRLLDTGRAQFLERYGFDVELVYYVEPRTSLENCALLAVPKRR